MCMSPSFFDESWKRQLGGEGGLLREAGVPNCIALWASVAKMGPEICQNYQKIIKIQSPTKFF